MANELIENPRLTGAKMLGQAVSQAPNMILQFKQLQQQQDQINQKKEDAKIDTALAFLHQAPAQAQVRILKTISPIIAKRMGIPEDQMPTFTEETMSDPAWTQLMDGVKQVQAMKGIDGKPLDKQSQMLFIGPMFGSYLNSKGKPVEATKAILGDDPNSPSSEKLMFTPAQAQAIQTGDPTVMAKAFPNGIPKDALSLVAGFAKQRESIDLRRQQRIDKNTQALSKQIESVGAPEAITQFATIANLLPKDGDVPGYGRAASLVPSFLSGDSGRALRQAVQGLQNVKIKDRSGAAVTPPEFVRLKEEFGTGKLKTEAQLRQGLNQAVSAYRERVRNAMAGYDEETKSEFLSRNQIDDPLETLAGFNFGGPVQAGVGIRQSLTGGQPAQGPVQIASDDEYNKLPKGTSFIGPDGKVRVKP